MQKQIQLPRVSKVPAMQQHVLEAANIQHTQMMKLTVCLASLWRVSRIWYWSFKTWMREILPLRHVSKELPAVGTKSLLWKYEKNCQWEYNGCWRNSDSVRTRGDTIWKVFYTMKIYFLHPTASISIMSLKFFFCFF